MFFPIHVTTLKERKDDIPLLAKHFVDLSVKELRCPKPRLDTGRRGRASELRLAWQRAGTAQRH